jgi:hypothetical protein
VADGKTFDPWTVDLPVLVRHAQRERGTYGQFLLAVLQARATLQAAEEESLHHKGNMGARWGHCGTGGCGHHRPCCWSMIQVRIEEC